MTTNEGWEYFNWPSCRWIAWQRTPSSHKIYCEFTKIAQLETSHYIRYCDGSHNVHRWKQVMLESQPILGWWQRMTLSKVKCSSRCPTKPQSALRPARYLNSYSAVRVNHRSGDFYLHHCRPYKLLQIMAIMVYLVSSEQRTATSWLQTEYVTETGAP